MRVAQEAVDVIFQLPYNLEFAEGSYEEDNLGEIQNIEGDNKNPEKELVDKELHTFKQRVNDDNVMPIDPKTDRKSVKEESSPTNANDSDLYRDAFIINKQLEDRRLPNAILPLLCYFRYKSFEFSCRYEGVDVEKSTQKESLRFKRRLREHCRDDWIEYQREVAEELGSPQVPKSTPPVAGIATRRLLVGLSSQKSVIVGLSNQKSDASLSTQKSNVTSKTTNQSAPATEPKEIEIVPSPSTLANENGNPYTPTKETIMEESFQVTCGRLRKTRSAGIC
ncbi:hypothetical protein RJT34_16755 [Clitoria ternatea]|uniref:Uncharacterized protein n=1 Tax=Clitoria ternatea TaxID=43366 RepID=A0AAN9J9T4_CLITE